MPLTMSSEMNMSTLDIMTLYPDSEIGKSAYVTRQKRSIRGSATAAARECRSQNREIPEHMQQNSYRLSPSEIFLCDTTRQRITELIQDFIAGKVYNERSSAGLTRDLSDKIKEAVKEITSNGRYKVVTYVTLGQKKLSTVMAASQCIWNEAFDRRVEIKVDNGELFVMALVFVLYVE